MKQKYVFFLSSLAFSMIQQIFAIWSLVLLPFLNPAWTSGSSVHILLKPMENFEHHFASVWDEYNWAVVWTFFGIGMKTDFFQSWTIAEFSKFFWHIEYSTFTASSFKVWNSSTGIPSLLLALFVVMLPKAHLSFHSRMSDSRWVITLLWWSGSWRSFLYSSSVYSCHLLLIYLFLLGPYHFCPYCAYLCRKCSLGILNFLEETSSLSHSIVFLCFFALITEEGFLISLCYYLELCIQMGISFLFSFAFSFSSFLSYL